MKDCSRIPGQTLRGALIGFGNVAVNAHLPLFNHGRFEIRAIVEPCAARADLARKLLPEARVYDDLDTMLGETQLDFVDICSPPCYHAAYAVKACHAGLHVLCEKPLATRFDELETMERAAREHHRVLFSVNNWKYAPIWQKTRQLVRSGAIGRVRSLSLSVLRPPHSGGGASDWRRRPDIAGGGILLDHGWHHLYLVLALKDAVAQKVSARMEFSRNNGHSIDETVDLKLDFNDGSEARVHLTWAAPCRDNRGRLEGDQGIIDIKDDHLVLKNGANGDKVFRFPEALSRGSHHLEWMRPVIDHFRREVLGDRPPGDNLQEAKWCARVIERAYESQRQGSRPVPLTE